MTQSEPAKAKAEIPCKAKALLAVQIVSLSEGEKEFGLECET